MIPHICRRSGRIFSADFFCGFCKVNLRRGLPHRRSSRGHNWRSAKAHKIFPLQKMHHFLFLFHSHSHSHCSTVMHMTRSQKSTYLSAKVQLQQRRDKEAPPVASLFRLIAITTNSECSQSPGSEAPCDPTKAPFQQGRYPHLSKLFWQTHPNATVVPMKTLLHIEAHRWAPHLRLAVGLKANLAQPAAQLGWRFFGALRF